MRLREHRNALVPGLLSVSLLLFVGAWIFGNPPSAAPDEVEHYVRALGAGGGDLRGRPPSPSYRAFAAREAAKARADSDPRRAARVEWQLETAREVTVPRGLTFSAFGCASGNPERSWACLDAGHTLPPSANKPTTHTGTYQPFLYVPPGVVMRVASDPVSAFRVGRAVNGAICVALLGVALLLLWNPAAGAWSLVGFMAAVTPMALFLASVMSPNGPEIAASVCFTAALIRLARDGPRAAWMLLALGAGGSILAISRPLGPVWVTTITLASVVLLGPRRSLARFLGSRGSIAAWAAILASVGVGLFWELSYQPHPESDSGDLLGAVPSAVGRLWYVLAQAVGYFDLLLPRPIYVLWALVVGGVLVGAMLATDRPGRLRLALLIVGVLGVVVAISALRRQPGSGFTMQGRYVLPLLVIVPLWAGELLSQRAQQLPRQLADWLFPSIVALTAATHVLAWYANGRRVAVGTDGSWLFPFDPEWDPPGGWIPWLVVMAAATGLYVLAGIIATRPRQPA